MHRTGVPGQGSPQTVGWHKMGSLWGSEVKVLIFSTPQVVPLTLFSNTVQKTSSWEESTHLRACSVSGLWGVLPGD